jgi:squalene-hopene/tetraprenyl-beta-curcumene cyclase
MRRLCFALGLCTAILVVSVRAQESSVVEVPTQAAIRAAAARGLPFLEKEGIRWMEERNCMSCHHVPFLLWTHREAREKGLIIDSKKLSDWDEWVRKDSLSQRGNFRLDKFQTERLDESTLPKTIQEKIKPVLGQAYATEADFLAALKPLLTADELTACQSVLVKTATLAINHPARNGGGLDVLAQLLLARRAPGEDPDDVEFRQGIVSLMQRVQLDDGSWTPGSQLQGMRQWTLPTANQTTTMWAALALSRYASPERSQAVGNAIAFLRQQPPQFDNREWLATRLLFEKQFGTAQELARLRQLLIDGRNSDGGWGWSKTAPSDPYTTGMALYVLAKVGAHDNNEVRDKAILFLLNSQQSDGSWKTEPKYISRATTPEQLATRAEIYHYWGTSWAVLGLLSTLSE